MKKFPLIFWLPLVFGIFVLLFAQAGEIKYTSDSHLYLEGASFLCDNARESLFQHPAFRAKPILFSVILMPFIEQPALFRFIQLICYCFTYVLTFNLVGKFIRDKHFLLIYNLLFVTSVALVMDHIFLWTEPVFLTLLSGYALLLFNFFGTPRRSVIAGLIIVAVMLCTLKHVGIFFVVPIAFWLLYFVFRRKTEKPLKILVILHLVLPMIYFIVWQWLVRYSGGNYERLDHFTGLDLYGNITLITEAIAAWFAPRILIKYISWLIVPAIFSLAFYSSLKFYNWQKSLTLKALTSMCLVYFTLLITKGDMIFSDDERYVSVIFPFLMLVVVAGVEKLLSDRPKIKPLILSAGGVFLCYNLIRLLKNVWFWAGH